MRVQDMCHGGQFRAAVELPRLVERPTDRPGERRRVRSTGRPADLDERLVDVPQDEQAWAHPGIFATFARSAKGQSRLPGSACVVAGRAGQTGLCYAPPGFSVTVIG